MPTFDTPGVFIEEQTGPGVIAGVGTSTAGFIGPARRGPLKEARRISSFDAFLSTYGVLQKDGTFDPHIKDPEVFLPHAVRGFFENGGTQAFIVRIGTATAALWEIKNRKGPDPADRETVFRIEALDEGTAANGIVITTSESTLTGAAGVPAANSTTTITGIDLVKKTVEVRDASQFRAGDIVTNDAAPPEAATSRAEIVQIRGNVLTLRSVPAAYAVNNPLRIANLLKDQATLRMASTKGLHPGSLVRISGKDEDDDDVESVGLIKGVDAVGFVTFVFDRRVPARTHVFKIDATNAPTLKSEEFDLKVTPPFGEEETFKNLSLQPEHPRFFRSTVASKLIQLLPALTPPTSVTIPERLVLAGSFSPTTLGTEDDLNDLRLSHFEEGLKVLAKVDDVNLVCIPDAAARGDRESIQDKMVLHCEDLKDRFAILDSGRGLAPEEVESQREGLDSARGFGALYYPWLEVVDPGSTAVPPRTMLIPPSGHIAGVFARTDQERGVHKAPANTDVRGILGLERVLSDGEQGPLNLKGINVLRIFPGSRTVVVWGARTIVNPIVTDWIYVNVRRLLLFIEESIQEGIRFAVFEPNAPPLWKALTRTISQFLTQVWRDGGLFGDTPDQAFRVRIDEALNPPSVRALGRLFIEIRVAPVRPAEFIVVLIGLFDGGAEVQET